MKQILKKTVQAVSSRLAPIAWRFYRQPRLLILMYHRVLPLHHPGRDSEQPGMFVCPATLTLHIELLRRHFTLIHLEEWIERKNRGQAVPARACALTFDDGWRDNYDYAYPILKSAGVPATIYLITDLTGTRYRFWPNILVSVLSKRQSGESCTTWPAWFRAMLCDIVPAAQNGVFSLSAYQIDRLIERCKVAKTDEQMTQAAQQIEGLVTVPAPSVERDLMDWDEARRMSADGLIRFGSHTRTHQRLRQELAAEMLEREILDSQTIIERQLGFKPSSFCYPNGDVCSSALQRVREHYAAAVTTRRGWNTGESDPYLLRRVSMYENVSYSPASFLSRLAGIG